MPKESAINLQSSQPPFSSFSTPAGLFTFTAASAPVTAASPFPSISDLHRIHIPEVHLLNEVVCTRSLVHATQLQLSLHSSTAAAMALDEAVRRYYSNESKLCSEEFIKMMQQQVNSDVACSCYFPKP
ncbi:hypothetical protein ACFX15_009254 [Malus domestica]